MHEGAKLWLEEEEDAQQSRGETKIPLNHGYTTAINSCIGIQHLAAPQAEGAPGPAPNPQRGQDGTGAVGSYPCPGACPTCLSLAHSLQQLGLLIKG